MLGSMHLLKLLMPPDQSVVLVGAAYCLQPNGRLVNANIFERQVLKLERAD